MVNRETVLLVHHDNGAGVLERGDKIVLEVDDEGGVTIALEGNGNGEEAVEESRGRRQANALVSKLMVSQNGRFSYTTPDRSLRRRANQALPNVALQPGQLGGSSARLELGSPNLVLLGRGCLGCFLKVTTDVKQDFPNFCF